MTLAAGEHLRPYEILSALGAGGMGEVYQVRVTLASGVTWRSRFFRSHSPHRTPIVCVDSKTKRERLRR